MTDREWARRMAALIRQPVFIATVGVTIIALAVGGLAWSAGPGAGTPGASGSSVAQHPSATPGGVGPSDDPWASLKPSTSLEPSPDQFGSSTGVLTAPAATGPIVPTDVTFQLASVDATPASVLAGRLTVDPAFGFAVQADATDQTARLTPNEPLMPGAVYRFALHGAGGELLDSWAFQARQPLRVVGTLPEDQSSDVPVDTGIEIIFDQDGTLDTGAHVSIVPATPGRSEQHGRTWVFIPTKRLTPATIYSVTVSPGVTTSGTGEATIVETRFRFETAGSSTPSTAVDIEFQDAHAESATAERPILGLWSYSEDDTPLTTTHLQVYKLADLAAGVEAFRTIRTRPTWAQWSTEGIVDTKTLHRVLSARIRLEPYQGSYLARLPNRLPAGWYLVQDLDGQRPAQSVLQVTDLAGYLAVTVDKTVVWANDLAHGGAVSGVLATSDGISIGRTDSHGLATGDTPKGLLPSENEVCASPCDPVVTLVAPGGRAVFLPASDSHDKFEAYGGGYYFSQADPSYWSVFHTDRNQYAPGDTVNLWGIVRDRATGTVPAKVTVQFTADTSDYAQRPPSVSMSLTPGPTGAFTGSQSLAGLEDGDYAVTMGVGDKVIASTSLSVGAFVKPAYALDITTGRRIYIAGDRIKVTVGAKFFEGTPLPGVPIRIAHAMAGNDVERTVTTDATGTGVYRTIAATDPSQEGAEEIIFFAAPARAEEGDITDASRETYIFPSSRNVDATSRISGGRVRVSGGLHIVDVARLESEVARGIAPWDSDPNGAAVAGARLTIRFYELIPVHKQIGTEYDFIEKKVVPIYEDSIRERAVGTVRATTNASGAFAASIPATTKDHDYRVVVSVGDPDGHTARSTVYAERHPWSADLNGSAGLRPTTATPGDGYGIGDRVDVTMTDPDTAQTSGDGTRYLFYVLQSGLHETTVQSSPRFVTTFRASSVPNVEIAAVRFTGHGYVGTVAFDASFRTGDRKLQVELTADAARYVPGGRVHISIRTRDASGSPIAATVILRTIDEKLYSMGAAAQDDPLAELYTPLGSGLIGTFLSHVPPQGDPGGGDTTGGGGDDRSDFRDSLLFTSVDTGADGRGSTSFALSDDLTSWRVSASAVSASLDAGYGSVSLPVGLPFFVDASIGREYLLADRPTIPVRVYGSAVTAADAVTIQVTSPSLGFDSGPIHAKAFATVAIPLPALKLGRQTVTIRATEGAGSTVRSDAVTRTFTVVDTHLTTSRTAYVELPTGGRLKGGSVRTTVLISDASAGRYLPLLTDIAAGGGARLDRGLAAAIAQTILAESYGPKATPDDVVGTFDSSRYQTENGGLTLLPYASADLELSVLVALVAPERVGRVGLSDYLHGILVAPNETRERQTFALAGLAGLGEPVMPSIQTAAADPSLTDRERLMLGLGAAALGDAATARTIAASLESTRGEQLGDQARLRVGTTSAEITEATALMAVLAASIGDQQAPLFWAYVDDNPAPDRLEVLTAVAYVARSLERVPVASAAFAYTLDGKRTTVDLAPGEAFELSLTASQLASLKVEPASGTLGVTTTWQDPVKPSQLLPDPDVTIVRTMRPAMIGSADLVTVTLRVTFGKQAAAGCHQVTELVPSGLTPVGSLAAWPDTEDEGGTGGQGYVQPYDQSGPRVFFCAEPDAKHPTITLRYVARVVTPGTYAWEPAIAESRSQEGRAALTAASTVTIH